MSLQRFGLPTTACLVVAGCVLLFIGLARGDDPPLTAEQRAELLELPRRYRGAEDDEQRREIIKRAIELGDKATQKLQPVVAGDVQKLAVQYGRLFQERAVIAAQKGEKVTFEAILSSSDKLAPLRKQLVAKAELADLFTPAMFTKQIQQSEQQVMDRLKNARRMNSLDAQERKVVVDINLARAMQGLPALTVDPKLCRTAKEHSNDMAAHNFFYHTSPLPGKQTMIDRGRIFGTSVAAENIAQMSSGAATVQAWMKSDGHRRNILSNAARLGVGRNGKYYTAVFGR